MLTHITISTDDIPETGATITGEADSSVLGLDGASLRCAGPISYRLQLTRYDNELLVRGSVETPFTMRCERCLDEFSHTVLVDDLALSYQLQEDTPLLDITDDLREELILALPAYPKCELAGKECQIHDINDDFRLDKAPSPGVDCATPSGESVWQALDKFPGAKPE